MKLVKTASGKTTIKMSKREWQSIGKKAGWTKKANNSYHIYNLSAKDDIISALQVASEKLHGAGTKEAHEKMIEEYKKMENSYQEISKDHVEESYWGSFSFQLPEEPFRKHFVESLVEHGLLKNKFGTNKGPGREYNNEYYDIEGDKLVVNYSGGLDV